MTISNDPESHDGFEMDPIHSREGGLSLVEIIVAFTIFAIFMLSAGATLMGGIAQRRYADETYRALSEVRDFVSDAQEIANLPQDLTLGEGIGALHALYQNQTFPAPGVPNGQISVVIHANEQTVPAELGGPQDLNFDSDDQDDLDSVAAGSDLKLVPMTITINYGIGNNQTTQVFHRLITNTVD
ncbi:MAG: prepilin-type N-terminal cleavage/methylation domain-containing protein [Planctomycetota bacterium]